MNPRTKAMMALALLSAVANGGPRFAEEPMAEPWPDRPEPVPMPNMSDTRIAKAAAKRQRKYLAALQSGRAVEAHNDAL
jgi:hypothetical protein